MKPKVTPYAEFNCQTSHCKKRSQCIHALSDIEKKRFIKISPFSECEHFLCVNHVWVHNVGDNGKHCIYCGLDYHGKIEYSMVK